MMSMDVSLGAAINAAPSPDATCAAADTSAGASDGFAALLDEAAGSTGDVFDSSAASDHGDADEEDIFDEMAALVTPSLLSLNTPMAPLPEDGNEEFASEGDVADGGSIADVAQSSLLDANVQPQLIEAGHSDASVVEEATEDADGSLSAEWNTKVQTATRADAAAETASLAETVASPASDVSGSPETPRAETVSTSVRTNAAPKPRRAEQSSRAAHAAAPSLPNLATHETSNAAAAQANAETGSTGRTQSTEKPAAPTSTAARLARALERAAALATGESSSSAALAASNNAGNGQSSGFGDQLGEHAQQSFGTTREGIGGLTFTVPGASAIDMRMLSRAVDAVSQAGEVTTGSIPERDVVAQLVQSMRMQFRDGIGEAVVKLRPEHLGSVQISIKVENGALTATVQAEAPAVRQWLESQQDTLKTGLADHGLRLERFVVEPDGEQRQASDDAQEREHRRRQQQRRMSGKDHPVFEVTV